MGLDKVLAAKARANLVLSGQTFFLLREAGVPESVLFKLELMAAPLEFSKEHFDFRLSQILTQQEVKTFGAMIERASDATAIQLVAGDWLDACEEVGIEIHTGPNTAGEIARRIANSGFRGHPGVNKNSPLARPNAKAKMTFDIANHLQPLIDASKTTTVPVTDPNDTPKTPANG